MSTELINNEITSDQSSTPFIDQMEYQVPDLMVEHHNQASRAPLFKDDKITGMRLIVDEFAKVNKELWLILSLLILAAAINYLVRAQRMVLGFYTLPTLFSAYVYGRRHATLTAFVSIFLIGLFAYFKPDLFNETQDATFLDLKGYLISAKTSITQKCQDIDNLKGCLCQDIDNPFKIYFL